MDESCSRKKSTINYIIGEVLVLGPSVIILGVGRSGTTALYKSLQNMMLSDMGERLDFVYEPFLWDWRVFNKRLDETGDSFTRVSSLGIEGIYQHKKTPLLIDDGTAQLFSKQQFFAEISRCQPGRDGFLSKIIRGNGRYRLFRAVSPEAKIVFMMRNPIDVINSSIAMFSLFGDDFYASDYERFYSEAMTLYSEDIGDFSVESRIQREALYWYVMNRHFLEASIDDTLVRKYVYEDYVRSRNDKLNDMAGFLGVAPDRAVLNSSSKLVGPSYGAVNLTHEEFDELLPYLELYSDLLKAYFPDVEFDKEAIFNKYSGRFKIGRDGDPFEGRTSLFIRKRLREERSGRSEQTLPPESKVKSFVKSLMGN